MDGCFAFPHSERAPGIGVGSVAASDGMSTPESVVLERPPMRDIAVTLLESSVYRCTQLVVLADHDMA